MRLKIQRCLASLFSLLGFLVFFFSSGHVSAQAPPSSLASDTEESEDSIVDWQRYYDQVAQGYQIEVQAETSRKLTHLKTPVLSYTNPVRGRQQHGSIYVWTDGGRPAALGSFWSIMKLRSTSVRITSHEMLTLANLPLRATRPKLEGMRSDLPSEWLVREPGVRWNDLPLGNLTGGSEIEPSAAQVRRVIRRVAKRFEAEFVSRRDQSTSQLRLLETPIFQYESDSKQHVGGLFAFSVATDPELILWLEYERPSQTAEVSTQSNGVWRYSVARMSLLKLTLRLDGNEVWSQPDLREKACATYDVQFRVCEFADGKPPE